MSPGDRVPPSQPWTGLPQTAHSALTPVGEIEQAAKIAEGLRRPREGWRRVVFRIGVLILMLGATAALVAGILGAAHP
ncbi:hypothetical protein GCM10020358_36160 [Amorphoplanes nipponensis]|uniref:Uncharacterized protein n=1 Tax=Actinoplanes nipponensis TaxID=135950 RepID=A0A919JDG3_9ACTN|nr:hypothetical protein [Actinoplanes nipponensis]GIE48974.1 hypothetical protein Ani05nite_25080 [Actinoplanes nipponensis]